MSTQKQASAKSKPRQVPAGTLTKSLGPRGKVLETKTSAEAEPEVSEEQRVAERRSNAAMQFATQQLSAPAAHQPVSADAIAAFQAEVAERAKALGLPDTVLVKVTQPKLDKISRNNVTRPGNDTKCGKIWAVCDAITAAQHTVAALANVKADPRLAGFVLHTVKTQYSRWRQFNGVKGRLPTIAQPPQRVATHDGNP